MGRNEGIEGGGTFFLGAGCCLHKNNRIVLRDKIKKARNEIFSREHVLSMLKASIFVLILVFPSKIRIEFYSTFFFFFFYLFSSFPLIIQSAINSESGIK